TQELFGRWAHWILGSRTPGGPWQWALAHTIPGPAGPETGALGAPFTKARVPRRHHGTGGNGGRGRPVPVLSPTRYGRKPVSLPRESCRNLSDLSHLRHPP